MARDACGLLVALMLGLGSDSCGTDDAAPSAPCMKGDTRECVGLGACQGGQVCLEDGSGYGECKCGSATGGASGAAGVAGVAGSGAGLAGIGGAAGEDAATGDASCDPVVVQGEPMPLDIYLELDRSASMQPDWVLLQQAIATFANAPETADVAIGLGLFPRGPNCPDFPPCPSGCITFGLGCDSEAPSCDAQDYLPPDVAIALAPTVAQGLVAAMTAQIPGPGAAPTLPALQAAAQVAEGRAKQATSHKVVVVLATDSLPLDCDLEVSSVAQVAANALAAAPSIDTWVIAVGNTGLLDPIAQAGGTSEALGVGPSNLGQQFLDALTTIRDRASACQFAIPAGQQVDLGEVNLSYATTGGAREPVFQVADETSCDPTHGGWFYDHPADPGRIELCSTSCDSVLSEGRIIDVELGCATLTNSR